MPFRSQAQRRLFYAKNARGEISDATLHEWEMETARKKLPEYAKKAKKRIGDAGAKTEEA